MLAAVTGPQADIRLQIVVLEAELLAAPAGLGADRLRLHHALAGDYGQLGDYRHALHHARHELPLRIFRQGPDHADTLAAEHPDTLAARGHLANWTGQSGRDRPRQAPLHRSANRWLRIA